MTSPKPNSQKMKLSVSKLEVSFSKSLVLGLFSTRRFPPLLFGFPTEGGLIQVEETSMKRDMTDSLRWKKVSGAYTIGKKTRRATVRSCLSVQV